MIPIYKIDSLILFIGSIIFIGSLEATLTTFNPSVGGASSDGNLNIQLTTGFIYASIFGLILIRLERFLPFFSKNLILMAFLFIPIISVAWSVSPDATLRRGIALIGSSFFAIYIAYAVPPERVLRILATAYALTAGASLILIVLLPVYGTHQFGEYAGLWRGVFSSKNELGATMAMGIILLFICPKNNITERLFCRFTIILCFLMLIMSESRTAWVSLVTVGIIAFALQQVSGRGIKTAFRTVIFAVIAVASIAGVAKYSEEILGLMGKDPTLTGRTGVWEVAIERAMERPLLGYGYRAYWTPENKKRLKPTEDWSDSIGHAHNTYIDLMVELGFLGIVAFMFIFSILIFRMAQRLMEHRDVINIWSISCISFIMIRGTTEATILQHADINWIYFVYFFALYTSLKQPSVRKQPAFFESTLPASQADVGSVLTMRAGDLVRKPQMQEKPEPLMPGLRDGH